MASNYKEISLENQLRYGTDIGRIGPMLLADRYDDRTHFIFELLQNAEDAIGRRLNWSGSRGVNFQLTDKSLTLSHFGKPFDVNDVRGVCGIAQSTKDLTSIGRFGIGFKSVYTFTDRPEIHSGNENFAVENFVLPYQVNCSNRNDDETSIVLPFRKNDEEAISEISNGLIQLGAGALLFLRNIEEITWSTPSGSSGIYLRSKPMSLGSNVQRITVIGQESGKLELDQNWLVFHREVSNDGGSKCGRVEIAFSIAPNKDTPDQWSIQPVVDSPLVVYFPTVVSTNLGFLVQGPYRTTPSRDNVPKGDVWNQLLVKETSSLLIEALRWLRDKKKLNSSTLRCLPLDHTKFSELSMFGPIFDVVRSALKSEPLLPRFDGGYISANDSILARTQELRELFSPIQIGALLGHSDSLAWLSGDITADRTPELKKYLSDELKIQEIRPETIILKLTKTFLEAQTDQWVLRLYKFLILQTTLYSRLESIPLIRLFDGSHVVAKKNGQAQAFLPTTIETSFPTIRPAVCATPDVISFLKSLGITEPDPVDDVLWNIIPKYQGEQIDVEGDEYADDIKKIQTAFNTDSKSQREKLVVALKETTFVMAFYAENGRKCVAIPTELYLATERLKYLFAGVPDILFVDDTYECLRGENVRELLEACGAVRYPRPVEAASTFNNIERAELRKQGGHAATSGYSDRIIDWTLHGFDALIKLLPTLNSEDRIKRGKLIWESLGDLEERRGRGLFEGLYSWTHNGSYKVEFQSAFMRQLNTTAWIADSEGELQEPPYIVFDTLGWKNNPFILSKIAFKPPIIEQLAKEAGFDPALLDLLKKYGITSEADLKSRFVIPEQLPEMDNEKPSPTGDVYDDASDLYGGLPHILSGTIDPDAGDIIEGGGNGSGNGGMSKGSRGPHGQGNGKGDHKGNGGTVGGNATNGGAPSGKRTPGSNGGRPFISYVGTHLDDESPDPDGLDQATRMNLEELAIQHILTFEPKLNRTPAFNAGYDLFENDCNGQPIRWVEVKAMTGTLRDRPVGLSHTQFNWARQHRGAFWLYVVEQASSIDKIRILRIQDPASNARTFTFDHGWEGIARTEPV